MAVKIAEMNHGNILEIQATEKFTHADYQKFVPEFERLTTKYGKINLLFEMVNFHGWDATAVWDDLKFNLKHFPQIDRLAMVAIKNGNKAWPTFAHRLLMPTFDSSTPLNLQMRERGWAFNQKNERLTED